LGRQFQGTVFTFAAATGEFTIPAALLKTLLAPLYAMTTIEMKEKEQGRAEIGEEDAEAFLYFVECAYSKKHRVPFKTTAYGANDVTIRPPGILAHWPCLECKNTAAQLVYRVNTPACHDCSVGMSHGGWLRC
jgi:hypothetical protein